ncbi:uncharacterized protein LOC128548896 [Mercenaria mercenaria]|uniref:uncharacterized protein LOC128548896 n=1 Tax=Mercenaria mercenaria TaxID=6596 RepID=UPI00234E9579|nr:uncharacterized protein LOC128548896 [Mercenaria mercenaria]
MSHLSLRRQLFHKNLDLLLQSGSLDTVEEEVNNKNQECTKCEQVTDLDATVEASLCTEPSDGADQALTYRSPIYRPKHLRIDKPPESGATSTRPLSKYDQCSTPYSEPWESKSAGGIVRPGTPYTEIDENTVGASKPSKCKAAPLKFEFPAPSTSVNKRHSLPFSPIHHTPVRAQFKGFGCCMTCEEDVRALPMSPALFVSQTTSTPGPTGVTMDSPTCQSILENNNSIFNFSECNMCRICHEDGSKEKLVSPCHCAGTMGMLHVSCLEQWLGSSNTTKCEICQFQFIVQKKPRPFTWYMKEPTLKEDRMLIVKDIVLLVSLGGLVLTICILCLVFAKQLTEEHKPGPAAVLILLTVCSLMLYTIWVFIAVRRMRRRVHIWHNEHHIIQIKQRQGCHGDTSNKIFRRFPVKLPSARQKKQTEKKKKGDNNLGSTSFIGCSLESYKAAMFNPVTPAEPLLQDMNNNDITSLNESSPSVISLDELIEECISYYQPPECGTTSVLLSNESGKILRETGV